VYVIEMGMNDAGAIEHVSTKLPICNRHCKQKLSTRLRSKYYVCFVHDHVANILAATREQIRTQHHIHEGDNILTRKFPWVQQQGKRIPPAEPGLVSMACHPSLICMMCLRTTSDVSQWPWNA